MLDFFTNAKTFSGEEPDYDIVVNDDGELCFTVRDYCSGELYLVTFEEVFEKRPGFFEEVDGGGWFHQRLRAGAAARSGYIGCLDWDDQGEVIMISTAHDHGVNFIRENITYVGKAI